MSKTTESKDYLEMAFHSIRCFADDGTLDVNELDEIMSIALRDGVVDENEKRVLSNILSRLNKGELAGELAAKVDRIRAEILN